MRKSRPSLPGLAEFADAVIGGSESVFGVNLNGSAGFATRNRNKKMGLPKPSFISPLQGVKMDKKYQIFDIFYILWYG